MSLRTSAGIARVGHLRLAFDLSRAALYKACSDGEPIRSKPPSIRRFTPLVALLENIRALARAHTGWGHRKIWAMLRRRGIVVSRRRVWEVMHREGLTFRPHAQRCEPRRGTVIVDRPNRRWSSDMTTTWTREDGWIALTPVIDNGCRSALAIGISKAQDAPAILSPVRESLQAAFGGRNGVPDGLELRTDHGSVYTGADCEALCDQWNILHTFAPVGRPTGNAVAERFIQTMKIELLWARDWTNIEELKTEVGRWRIFYNTERPHEALNWQTPAERRAHTLEAVRSPHEDVASPSQPSSSLTEPASVDTTETLSVAA